MKTRNRWLAFGLLLLLMTGIAAVLLVPRLRLYSLSVRLNRATTPAEAAKLILKVLSYDSQYSRDIVAQYAGKSPLRSFDADHGIFLMHDDQTGNIYEIVTMPAHDITIKDGPPLQESAKRALIEAVDRAIPDSSEIARFVIGKPPEVFSEIRLLPESASQHTSQANRVTFLLKVRDEDKYYRIVFGLSAGRVASETLYNPVSEAELRKGHAAGIWPQGDNH